MGPIQGKMYTKNCGTMRQNRSVDILMPQTASRFEKETPQTANTDDHATNKNVEHGQYKNKPRRVLALIKQGNVCKQEMTPNPETNMKKSPRSPGTKVNRLGPQLGSRHQAKMSHTQKWGVATNKPKWTLRNDMDNEHQEIDHTQQQRLSETEKP